MGKWNTSIESEIDLHIGIMGLGQLGVPIAEFLLDLGFKVSGYSSSPKNLEGIQCYSANKNELQDFLEKINTLVCLLPLNEHTSGILNRTLFSQIKPASLLINVGRGSHLIEEDLIPAIQSGQIAQAWLDVFQREPLPANHAFWKQKEIIITPHIASITDQEEAAKLFAENFKRMRVGKALMHVVDREKGY